AASTTWLTLVWDYKLQQRREIIEMQLRKMPVDYSNDGDLIGALTTRTSGWSSKY
ncbi:hypothetical protein EV182_001722, partial [Spiromyces aspiralis]